MITKKSLIAEIQKHFWNSENWFSQEVRSEAYWTDAANRVRGERWIAFHLASYDPSRLRSAFPECLADIEEDVHLSDDGTAVRSALARSLEVLLAPDTEDGRRIDEGVDSMACFYFNNRVLHPLAKVGAQVEIGNGKLVSASDLLFRRSRDLRRFDLLVKSLDDLPICISGSYDQVVRWLAQSVLEPG